MYPIVRPPASLCDGIHPVTRLAPQWRVDLRHLAHRAAPLLLAFVAACGHESLTCPLRPDMTGLTVELSAVPTGAYTVEVLVPTSSPVSYVYRCDGGPSCRGSRVFFPGLVTPFVTVRITTLVGTRSTPYQRVQYTDAYPNGSSCEPRSTSATIMAALPE